MLRKFAGSSGAVGKAPPYKKADPEKACLLYIKNALPISREGVLGFRIFPKEYLLFFRPT